jgi:hypothetical protein
MIHPKVTRDVALRLVGTDEVTRMERWLYENPGRNPSAVVSPEKINLRARTLDGKIEFFLSGDDIGVRMVLERVG